MSHVTQISVTFPDPQIARVLIADVGPQGIQGPTGPTGPAATPLGTPFDLVPLDPCEWFLIGNRVMSLPAFTYADGPNGATPGVGATVTADANGALSALAQTSLGANELEAGKLNGSSGHASPQVGERVLLDDDSVDAHQGIYTITSLGSAGSKWVLTRAADADDTADSVVDIYTQLAGKLAYAYTSRYDASDSFVGSGAYYGFAIRTNGFATQYGSKALGPASSVIAQYGTAGAAGVAIGVYTKALGQGSVAIGNSSKASGVDAVAIGQYAHVQEDYICEIASNFNDLDDPELGEGGVRVVQGIEETQTVSFGILRKHCGRFIPCNHPTVAIVATLPTNASVPIPFGSRIEFGQQGAAVVTIAAAGGVTLIGASLSTSVAGNVLVARKVDTNTWWIAPG